MLLVLLSLLLGTIYPASAAPDGWVSLASGIDFQLFHLSQPRPINLFVARLSRSEPSATIDTAIAQGKLVNGRETISGMASRVDQSISYWGEGWGGRNRVVVAINGYFFNLSTGEPFSGQIISGWYARRFSDYVGDAGFAWNLNHGASIGKCVFHTPRDQFLTVLRSGEIRKIDGINRPRAPDELVMYTPQYDATTRTDSNGVEVLVEMSRPTLVLPSPAMVFGQVVQMRDFHGNTLIPFDHVVLSASGTSRTGLLARLQVGDEIGISQEIENCAGSPAVYWTKTYAALAGDYHYLTSGSLTIDTSNGDAAVPNSRTAIAYNSTFVYFIVVDGWNPGASEGINLRELGEFSRDNLGASDGVTLDSGGSSTMVINGSVVNNTYCNFTRKCGNGKEPSSAEKASDLEALVGNAVMMISVEPKTLAPSFADGQAVRTALSGELRLGPGTNYAVIANLPSGAEGKALGMRYNNLNGVLAKGAYWLRAEFGDQAGWLRQELLVGVLPPNAPHLYMPLIKR
jgi:hypothetical protein